MSQYVITSFLQLDALPIWAAKATASSVSEYVMIEVTGPKASMSWTASAHGSSACSTVAATYATPCSAASRDRKCTRLNSINEALYSASLCYSNTIIYYISH